MSSYSIADKDKRHSLRKQGKCKIPGCKQRGRYNYGREYFYHGFCKDHYSLYQEGIIDFAGNPIRPKLQGSHKLHEKFPIRKKGKRWNKKDHVKHNCRCKVVGCENKGELSRGRWYFFQGFCSYHYRDWYLKGFMDIEGKVIIHENEPKKVRTHKKRPRITREMIRNYKISRSILLR